MVSPINGEKPIASSAERPGESSKNGRPEQPAGSTASSPENKSVAAASESPKLDQARQLYDLENQAARPAGERIDTPEAARSLLDQILEQISSTPEQALKAQGEVTSPLANLLQAAPG
jgi:hypothetical protein